MDFSEIIIIDYCGFLFDLNIKFLFKIRISKYNKILKRTLNSNNRVHKAKFKSKLEAYIKDSKLYEKVASICRNRVTPHKINVLDNKLAYVLNTARRHAEGFRILISHLEENNKSCLI